MTSEDRPAARAAGAHRAAWRARVDEEEHFWREVYYSPFALTTIGVGGLLCLAWGATTAVDDTADPMLRLCGAAVAVLGLLVWTSYGLKFRRGLFDRPWWSSSAGTRALRLVLRHAWWVFFFGAGAIGIGYQAVRLMAGQ